MNKTTKLLVATLFAAFTVPALAQAPATTPSTPNIDKREANQQRRIDEGVKSGQLTPREAARLEKGQQRVEKIEARAKADGKVTPRERTQIEHAQNRESRAIEREKHDRQHVKK